MRREFKSARCAKRYSVASKAYEPKMRTWRIGVVKLAFWHLDLRLSCGAISLCHRMISVALIPPNPNEFDSATSKLCLTALFGT